MFPRVLTDIVRGVGQLLYPAACLLCDAAEADGSPLARGFCPTCRDALTTDPHATCPRCAMTVGPHTDTSDGCPACRPANHPFDAAVRMGRYDGRLREAVLRTKSLAGEPVAEMLARLWIDTSGDRLRTLAPDVVVPVPLHWAKRFSRVYNQAEAVGRELAAGLGVPLGNWLARTTPSAQHAQPSAAARRANIRGAFRVRRRASPARRTLLLVDDVMTTGSTLGEAARVLRAAGAARVGAAVLARD